MPATDEPVLVELDLPARAEVVAVARMVVCSLAMEDPSFDEERVDDIRLAVSEACTNAIEAHLSAADESPVHLACRLAPGQVEVSIRDYGGGFDPSQATVPADLTDPSRLDYEGGLGIPLIRLLADDVTFRPCEDGTEVVMTFGPQGTTGRVS